MPCWTAHLCGGLPALPLQLLIRGTGAPRTVAATIISRKAMTREQFLARPVDEEWERARRRETQELQRRMEDEDEEEERRMLGYRRAASDLRSCREEDVRRAKRLVANLIKSGDQIEEMIVQAADNEELTPVVLLVISTRLEIARQDDERHVIQALDLLYRRIEFEMMKREASPAMRFLNELLALDDGTDHVEWLRRARHAMLNRFPPETPLTILVPAGFELNKQQGPVDAPKGVEHESILLRVDFLREVDQFIANVEAQQEEPPSLGLDAESVALRLKQQEKKRAVECVKDLLDLAASLKW